MLQIFTDLLENPLASVLTVGHRPFSENIGSFFMLNVTRQYDVTCWNTALFIVTAVRTFKLTQ